MMCAWSDASVHEYEEREAGEEDGGGDEEVAVSEDSLHMGLPFHVPGNSWEAGWGKHKSCE
jgi:hypothetical protein